MAGYYERYIRKSTNKPLGEQAQTGPISCGLLELSSIVLGKTVPSFRQDGLQQSEGGSRLSQQ